MSKYITNNNGQLQEVIANTVSGGSGDAGKIIALDSAGRIDNSMMPVGIGADTASILTSEVLSSGNYVNIWNNAGAFNVRKADATIAGKEAHGFVLSSYNSSTQATVYFEGTNTGVTGQTPGVVFLSTTAGIGSSTAPSASGNAVQVLGFAVSATAVNFQSNRPVILA